jgi:hypothetical protein
LLRGVDGPDRKPHALCFHPNGDHLCAAYYQQLCIFRWHLAATYMEPPPLGLASPSSSGGGGSSGRTGSRKGSSNNESKGSSIRGRSASPAPEPPRLEVTLSATLTMDKCRIMFVDWLPPPIAAAAQSSMNSLPSGGMMSPASATSASGVSSAAMRAPNTLLLVYEQEGPIAATIVTYVISSPSSLRHNATN